MSTHRVDVGAASEFADDSMTPFEVNGRDVLVVFQGGAFYAMEDRCTHDNGILHDGELLDGAVKCERHGAKFDLESGRATLPAVKKIRLYRALVEGERVVVEVQEV